MKVGQYYYQIRGHAYRIYRCDYHYNGIETASPVRDEPLYENVEEARKRVFELNGWKYKGPRYAASKAQP